MVHALEEIRRVLQPAGTLIDLRPLAGRWPVDVVSRRETLRAGQVSDLQQGLEDDAAANRAMAKAAEDRWFVRGAELPTALLTGFAKMQGRGKQWADFIEIDERSVKLVPFGHADADARIGTGQVLITRWKNAV
jgi:hypothetical protein